jgi:YVTN family beta-propeller protein
MMRTFRRWWLTGFLISAAISVNAETPPLEMGDPIRVPGTKKRFDYLEVDKSLHRLLADHTENGTLDVIDLPDGKLRKSVPTGAAQGVAVDTERNRYYVTVSDKKSLAVIDRQSLEVVGEVPLPGAPDSLAYNPKNGLVYVGHDDGNDVWVIDPAARKVVATIDIPTAPEYVVYDPVSDRVYQNIKSTPVMVVIDPSTNKKTETWPTEPAQKPHGLAIDSETKRLFAAGGNGTLAVLDANSGKVLSSVDIVPGVDQIAFDAGNKRIYCASGRAGLSVLEETDHGVKSLGNIATPAGAHTVAVDPATHAVWIAYAKEDDAFIARLSVR